MTVTTSEKKLLTVFFSITFVFLILASLFDLAISENFASQASVFGTIFQIYGMFPEHLVLYISASILAYAAINRSGSRWIRYFLAMLMLLVAFWGIYGMVQEWFGYTVSMLNNIKDGIAIGAANNDSSQKVVYSKFLEFACAVGIWGIGEIGIFKWLSEKDGKQLKYLILVAFAGIAFYFISGEIINTMKDYWGRFRPYEINEQVEGGVFTNWWHLNGINGHKSFPSGHTLAGMSAIFFTYFVDRKNTNLQKKVAYAGTFYGLLMGISRVRVGAHFLSDISVSAILTFLTAFLIMKLLDISLIEENK